MFNTDWREGIVGVLIRADYLFPIVYFSPLSGSHYARFGHKIDIIN